MSAREHVQGRGVVVGADGSASGYTAVGQAAHEADRRGVRLDIVHVIPVDVPTDGLSPFPEGSLQAFGSSVVDQAARVARGACSELEVVTHLLSGPRVPRLVEFSRDAELLVVGSRPASTIEQIWTGDTCPGVASQASTPVLVVPASWMQRDPHHRIVVGYKSAAHSRELVRAALAEAQRGGAELVILHAWRLPSVYDDIVSARVDDTRWNHAEATRIEREIAATRSEFSDVAVVVRVVHEHPARGLVMASGSADLVVVSRPAHGGYLHHLGGTARRLLRLSECPVEVIPPSADLEHSPSQAAE